MATDGVQESKQEELTDLRTIEITFGHIKDLPTIYQHPEITLKVDYLGESILETEKLKYDETDKIAAHVTLTIDLLQYSTVDNLISNPLVLTVIETEGTPDSTVIQPPERSGKAMWRSEESILDLEEALLGTRTVPDKGLELNKSSLSSKKSGTKGSAKGRDGAGKSSKSSKGSKGRTDSVIKAAEQVAGLQKPQGPHMAGSGIIDLLPLFTGEETEFGEVIILQRDSTFPLDDRMRPKARLPKIEITVEINEPIPQGCLYNMTIESIFNIPAIMTGNMTYKMVIHIPACNNLIIPFNNCTYTTNPREQFTNKRWYGTNRDTNYYIDGNLEGVKSCFCARASDVISADVPRIDYNILKRNYASRDDIEVLKLHLKNYRCIMAEILIQKLTAVKTTEPASKEGKKSVDRDSKTTESKKGKAAETETEPDRDNLHCMVYLDMCRLLYPGQRVVRIAAPLRTFNMEEAETTGGLKNSYFKPKPVTVDAESTQVEKKGNEKKQKGKEKDSSKKDSKKGGSKNGGNLANKLPPPPPPPEPSKFIYNENGMPTFILIQFEFKEPIIRGRDLEDLTEELNTIILGQPDVQTLPKTVESPVVTEKLYKDTLRTISLDIKREYLNFQENGTGDFLQHLQGKGVYQNYLSTITRVTASHVNAVYDFDPKISSGDYQIFISKAYVMLVEKMNSVINELFKAGINPADPLPSFSDNLLRYAYEAMELDLTNLANRYFLQRICDEESNPDFWFAYAIYHMHINEREKAIECAKEALKHNPNHKNSLVLYALGLSEKKRYTEAETCLLSVTIHDPTWMEGWGALYCVYFKKSNPEGMEVCMDIAQKNLEIHTPQTCMDLAWTTALIPNTFFYRTSCYFISLRFFAEAQLMIANEILNANEAVNEYLLAVISYYKRDYDHAILHIDNAMKYGGCDYTKCSLRGHILAKKGIVKCAIEEYKKIFKLFDQPKEEYVYFVYVKSGMCYSQMKEDQNARIAFLHASQINGTPFTWLSAGILYYYQKDFLSAEDCLTQSNTMDNRLPETWAYLALVNVKLKKAHEASMCLNQAEKHKLENQELLEVTRNEVKDLIHVFESL